MAEPFLGEIRVFGFGFAPKGWAVCNGQTLAINQNAALFALIGTTYGGNGTTTFNLPDLQGRSPLHTGAGFTGVGFPLGQAAGEPAVTLSQAQMPAHTHTASANAGVTNGSNATTPAGNFWGNGGVNAYAATSDSSMNPASVPVFGGGQPHENMSPYLVLNFCIAMAGIFPSRN
jgi:microcystin-dependent protein